MTTLITQYCGTIIYSHIVKSCQFSSVHVHVGLRPLSVITGLFSNTYLEAGHYPCKYGGSTSWVVESDTPGRDRRISENIKNI
jgi:hypothetical protein